MYNLNLRGGGSTFCVLTYKPSWDEWRLNGEQTKLNPHIIHPHTLKTGWVLFAPGMAPDWHWDEALGKPGKAPSSDHKRCFSIDVETEANGRMTWSGAGYGQCVALEELMEAISASESDYPGKVPLAEYVGSESRKIGKGSTRIPRFSIIDWVDPAFPPWAAQEESIDAPF